MHCVFVVCRINKSRVWILLAVETEFVLQGNCNYKSKCICCGFLTRYEPFLLTGSLSWILNKTYRRGQCSRVGSPLQAQTPYILKIPTDFVIRLHHTRGETSEIIFSFISNTLTQDLKRNDASRTLEIFAKIIVPEGATRNLTWSPSPDLRRKMAGGCCQNGLSTHQGDWLQCYTSHIGWYGSARKELVDHSDFKRVWITVAPKRLQAIPEL